MNVHKNARLTPQGRLLMVRRIEEEGWKVADAASAAGLSVRRTYHWLGRYRAGGERMLCDRSSTPARYRAAVPAERVIEIGRLRRQRMTGPQIARRLVMPRCERPGELIHLDIKTLGKIDGVGHRITGYHAGHHRARGVGHEHLHVAIDDASRLAYTEILPSLGQQDATDFLERALAWYRRLGITVERVMTDNGSAYRSKFFATALHRAGARHIRTRPYTPRTNGKAERFIQTSLREWAYARAYSSSAERTQAMQPWILDYNHSRPHSALGGLPPAARLNNVLGFDT